MSDLNKLTCGGFGANVGFGECNLNPQKIQGAFLAPLGFSIADGEDALAALLAASKEDVAKNRVYPIHGFVAVNDSSEDKTTQTFGYGSKAVVKEGFYDWNFQFVDGGLCLSKALRKFNGAKMAAFFYDAQGIIYGTKVDSTIEPIPLEILWTNPLKINDGSNATIYGIQFVFMPNYMNEDVGFMQEKLSSIMSIKGLQNAVVKFVAAGGAAGSGKYQVVAGCDASNLYDDYSSILSAAANWKATNTQTGNAIAITSVTANALDKNFTVLLTVADPDWTAITAGQYASVGLAAVSVLDAAGLEGFESVPAKVLGTDLV